MTLGKIGLFGCPALDPRVELLLLFRGQRKARTGRRHVVRRNLGQDPTGVRLRTLVAIEVHVRRRAIAIGAHDFSRVAVRTHVERPNLGIAGDRRGATLHLGWRWRVAVVASTTEHHRAGDQEHLAGEGLHPSRNNAFTALAQAAVAARLSPQPFAGGIRHKQPKAALTLPQCGNFLPDAASHFQRSRKRGSTVTDIWAR